MKRPKTPEELSTKKRGRPYTLYLKENSMDYIKSRASKANVSVSAVVDEAISAYIEKIKKKKDS